jgi:hypothetical protein
MVEYEALEVALRSSDDDDDDKQVEDQKQPPKKKARKAASEKKDNRNKKPLRLSSKSNVWPAGSKFEYRDMRYESLAPCFVVQLDLFPKDPETTLWPFVESAHLMLCVRREMKRMRNKEADLDPDMRIFYFVANTEGDMVEVPCRVVASIIRKTPSLFSC